MSEQKTQIKLNNEICPRIHFGLVGPAKSGKLSLMERISRNKFSLNSYQIFGQNLTLVKIDVNNEKFEISFLNESSAYARFDDFILINFVKRCDYGILVYDITQDSDYNFNYLNKMVVKIN